MVMTNVHKESKIKHWNIDTRFRDDFDHYNELTTGARITSYTFTLPESINDVKAIKVDNAEIPLSFYNISTSMGNNVMRINGNLVTVADGFYNPSTGSIPFKTAINTALSNASLNASFDISYNGTPRTIFTNNSASTMVVSFPVKPSNTCNGITKSATATGDFDKFNVKSKLGWMLGFRNIVYNIPSGGTLNSESIYDLNMPRYLYLVVDEFTSSNTNSFISPLSTSIINKNILAKITIDYTHYIFGQVIAANPTNGLLVSDRRSYNGKVNIQKLKIQLINEYGIPMNLNGLDFSFCLRIECE
jgi:hypothetical protein